jgi:recombination protein RecT
MSVKNTGLAARAGKQTFSTFLTADAVKNKINQIIGGRDGQRFIAGLISAVSTNPGLAECDHSTILSAALLGESLKLSPSPQLGQYYITPFRDNTRGRIVATFVLGYRGYIQLAIRSGQYKRINVLAIKEGELKGYNPLTEEITVEIVEDDELREQLPTVGYYAYFEYLNGFTKALYWSHKRMEAHAVRYSKGYAADKRKGTAYTFWAKDFDGMACKTMLRQIISKWGIMSVEMQRAFEGDMGLIQADGTPEYVDTLDIPDEPAPAPAPVADVPEEVELAEMPGIPSDDDNPFLN